MNRPRAAPIALASCVSVACSRELPPPLSRPAPTPPSPSLAAALDVSSAGPLPALARELAAARGLTLPRLPELVELTRSELIATAMSSIRAQTPDPLRAGRVRVLAALELAPSDFDYFAAIEQALSEGLQAFYDADRRAIFADKALASEEQERAVLHELVHAAQFGERDPNALPASSDQRAAVHTLAEGEATYVTERLRPRASGANDAAPDMRGASAGVPDVVLCALAAPYADGRALVLQRYRAGGWAAIDELWASPPQSTHELLHPDAVFAPPELVLPPAPDADGWILRGSDVLGEQALRCVLEQWWAEPEARRIAAGWSGDRLVWFETERETALVWTLQLTSGESAAEAQRAFRDGLGLGSSDVRHGAQQRASNLACRAHRDSGVVAVLSQAEQVSLLALHGLPTEARCRRLAAWSARVVAARAQPSTRVEEHSPVSIHP